MICKLCNTDINTEVEKGLPFYTIVKNCRTLKVCPDCWDKNKEFWMI